MEPEPEVAFVAPEKTEIWAAADKARRSKDFDHAIDYYNRAYQEQVKILADAKKIGNDDAEKHAKVCQRDILIARGFSKDKLKQYDEARTDFNRAITKHGEGTSSEDYLWIAKQHRRIATTYGLLNVDPGELTDCVMLMLKLYEMKNNSDKCNGGELDDKGNKELELLRNENNKMSTVIRRIIKLGQVQGENLKTSDQTEEEIRKKYAKKLNSIAKRNSDAEIGERLQEVVAEPLLYNIAETLGVKKGPPDYIDEEGLIPLLQDMIPAARGDTDLDEYLETCVANAEAVAGHLVPEDTSEADAAAAADASVRSAGAAFRKWTHQFSARSK